jgi:hypothetical protein
VSEEVQTSGEDTQDEAAENGEVQPEETNVDDEVSDAPQSENQER